MPRFEDFPDIVRDALVETESIDEHTTRHVRYEAGRSARQRRVRKEEQWKRSRRLGQGAYGTVYLESCSEDDGSSRVRAVKEISKCVNYGEELDYWRELEAIFKFSHPNVSHGSSRPASYLLAETASTMETNPGSFTQRSTRTASSLPVDGTKRTARSVSSWNIGSPVTSITTRAPLPETEAQQITAQIVEGLVFMHGNQFVHRDLKPSNVMVVNPGPDWFVKIADFGTSKRRQAEVTTLHTMHRGTTGYAAPEIFGFCQHGGNASYTFTVDIWSLGAMIYKLCTFRLAFEDLGELARYAAGTFDFPMARLEAIGLSKQGCEFILGLMSPQPEERPSALSTQNSAWLTQHVRDKDSGVGAHRSRPSEPVREPTIPTATNQDAGNGSAEAPTIRHRNYCAPYIEDGIDEGSIGELPNLPVDSRTILKTSGQETLGPGIAESQTAKDHAAKNNETQLDVRQQATETGTMLIARSEDPVLRLDNTTTYEPDCPVTPSCPTSSDLAVEVIATAKTPLEHSEYPPLQLQRSCGICQRTLTYIITEPLGCGHHICHACLFLQLLGRLLSPWTASIGCCLTHINWTCYKRILLGPGLAELEYQFRLTQWNLWNCPTGLHGTVRLSMLKNKSSFAMDPKAVCVPCGIARGVFCQRCRVPWHGSDCPKFKVLQRAFHDLMLASEPEYHLSPLVRVVEDTLLLEDTLRSGHGPAGLARRPALGSYQEHDHLPASNVRYEEPSYSYERATRTKSRQRPEAHHVRGNSGVGSVLRRYTINLSDSDLASETAVKEKDSEPDGIYHIHSGYGDDEKDTKEDDSWTSDWSAESKIVNYPESASDSRAIFVKEGKREAMKKRQPKGRETEKSRGRENTHGAGSNPIVQKPFYFRDFYAVPLRPSSLTKANLQRLGTESWAHTSSLEKGKLSSDRRRSGANLDRVATVSTSSPWKLTAASLSRLEEEEGFDQIPWYSSNRSSSEDVEVGSSDGRFVVSYIASKKG
ncbi:uncharacterized protein B0I36DRAFT_161477 [Microdochium trichocladiopsis]|uniref:non-specific serine/threonine protein kinase n=1 Tax=Microdochium trichocladiopsis TaxID=1682393 RepID=A0A9P9BRB8_9PEZI|nr:uncharacterized protein B0I36DRAFT_161477 [Microdochium trichocladiopsis]KAH7026727.1 hypothetical protein B0I36DRAFT_161477 [Microdochium trichocladiopsis]